MSNLTGKSIKDTYKDVLTINTESDNDGLTTTLRAVGDGAGTEAPIKLSTSEVAIGGSYNYISFPRTTTSGSVPTIAIAGPSTNMSLLLQAKGTGTINFDSPVKLNAGMDADWNKITNVDDPTSAQDAATKTYVDTNFVKNSGTTTGTITMSGTITAGGGDIITQHASSNANVWWKSAGVSRAVAYFQQSTGNFIISPYNSSGAAIANSTITLLGDGGGLRVGGNATYQKDGNINGSLWGGYLNTFIDNQLNTKLNKGDTATTFGWYISNPWEPYSLAGGTVHHVVGSGPIGSHSSCKSIVRGWDSTYGAYETFHNTAENVAFLPWASGEALKEDIKPATEKGLDKIRAMPMKSFKYKQPKEYEVENGVVDGKVVEKSKKERKNLPPQRAVPLGVVAEDIQAIYPEAVIEVEGVKQIVPQAMISLLLKSVQELSVRVEQLEGKK